MGSCYGKQEILLSRRNEVYDVEIITILKGLKQVMKSSVARVASKIYICLNNLGVACNKDYIHKSSSQKVLRKCSELAEI